MRLSLQMQKEKKKRRKKKEERRKKKEERIKNKEERKREKEERKKDLIGRFGVIFCCVLVTNGTKIRPDFTSIFIFIYDLSFNQGMFVSSVGDNTFKLKKKKKKS